MSANKQQFEPDAFVTRLRELRRTTGLTGTEIAQQGGITKQTFSGYLHTGRLPSAAVVANWVFRLGISANWLLTGKGPVMLDSAITSSDPVIRRMAVAVEQLRQDGAGDEQMLRSVLHLIEEELGKGEARR